jgi:peptidoglycan hydrolase CwlO-like protein
MRRLATVILLTTALGVALPAGPSGAQSGGEGSLRSKIAGSKARERSLGDAAARLGRLEAQTAREVGILQQRLGDAQTDLNSAEARLAATQQKLDTARKRVTRLRGRLAVVRTKLGAMLRARYMSGTPDFTTVVLHSDGFPQLLETLSFLHRVQTADSRLLDLVRSARLDAGREQFELTGLAARQRDAAAAVRQRRDALAGITAGLQARQGALAQARAARLDALAATRSRRVSAEHALAHLLAERAKAAMAPGPGGPWAIPWPIVQCESGGQNLPPNYASASGYYQMLDSTWAGLGGSTKHAFQASKAEQDRLAAKLWNGGAGRDNWVCAGLVANV